MALLGVDISSHQPWPDYKAISRACDFALIKVSGGRGPDYFNPESPHQVRDARASGLLVGYYHYLFEVGCAGSGVEEAAWFLACLPKDRQPGETLWLDVEQEHTPADGRDYADHVYEWLVFVERATGVTPGIYTGNYFIQEHPGLKDPRFARFPLWLASWQAKFPPVPYPWKRITVWQYADDVVYGGTAYDGNWFGGTRAEFQALAHSNKEEQVREPQANSVAYYVNEKGETLVVANFGGHTAPNGIVGVNFRDLGVSVVDDSGHVEDRSIQDGQFREWTVRPFATKEF